MSGLISPLCTVLDDSIGCALWFGARGRGRLHGQVQQTLYLSQARVSGPTSPTKKYLVAAFGGQGFVATMPRIWLGHCPSNEWATSALAEECSTPSYRVEISNSKCAWAIFT